MLFRFALISVSMLCASCGEVVELASPAVDLPDDPVQRAAICMESILLAERNGEILPEDEAHYGPRAGYLQIGTLGAIENGRFSQARFDAVAEQLKTEPRRAEMEVKHRVRSTMEQCWDEYPELSRTPPPLTGGDDIALGCFQFISIFDHGWMSQAPIDETTERLERAFADMPLDQIEALRNERFADLLQSGRAADVIQQCKSKISR